ncbi:MAG: CHASE3 domain-containing protein [Candidatus Eremiobacteraeota bacterium]|nr:CHASE3 domain-containing protein [Candidatus Eremiobacteraeota bacterium]
MRWFDLRLRLLLIIGAPLLVIALLAAALFWLIGMNRQEAFLTQRASRALATSEALLRRLVDAETGMRGYAATGMVAFVEPYRQAVPEVPRLTQSLMQLVGGEIEQLQRADEIQGLAAERMAEVGRDIDDLSRGRFETVRARLRSLSGKRAMDALRQRIQVFEDEERRIRDVHLASFQAAEDRWQVVLWMFSGLAVAVTALVGLSFFRAQNKAERYHLLAQNASDIMLFIDPRTARILEANQAAIDAYGYSREELSHVLVSDLRIAEEREPVETFFEKARRTGGSLTETTALRKDGTTFAVEVAAKACTISGKPVLLTVLRDITERRRAARELARAAVEAREASRLKSEFVATMSHEVRTPMNGVVGMAELMLESDLSQEQRRRAVIVRDSAFALLRVINDVLDLSKIEAGKLDLEEAEFSLHDVIESVAALLGVAANEHRVVLSTAIAPGVPARLVGDAGRLRQVLFNIAGNAVKFTEDGGVDIRVQQIEATPGGVELRFIIADTGAGVPPEMLPRLFEPFTQADGTTRRYGGTGLGLSISRRLIDLMGGTIHVESATGKGTTVVFTARFRAALAAPAPSHSALAAATQAPASLWVNDRRPRILVAEDNEINRDVALDQLTRLGCDVEFAVDGAEAVQMAARNSFDAILMDCHLPELDGFEATRAIRENEKGDSRRVPIIALTANALPADRAKSIEAGMDDYLTKPVRLAALRTFLAQWTATPT